METGAEPLRKIFASLIFILGLSACGVEAKPPLANVIGPPPAGQQQAAFAGGCFWCTEHDFEAIPGVIEAISGYTGGTLANPSYEDVVTETTGHFETVMVRYDPKKITYAQLVERFWRLVDPTDEGGQFCDRGPSYRTAIFVADGAQRKAATASKAALEKSGLLKSPVVTPILPLAAFYRAEEYHQEYSEKNTVRYNFYRFNCGRDARLARVWGAAPKAVASK